MQAARHGRAPTHLMPKAAAAHRRELACAKVRMGEPSRARHVLTAAELAPGNEATLAALTVASKRPPQGASPSPLNSCASSRRSACTCLRLQLLVAGRGGSASSHAGRQARQLFAWHAPVRAGAVARRSAKPQPWLASARQSRARHATPRRPGPTRTLQRRVRGGRTATNIARLGPRWAGTPRATSAGLAVRHGARATAAVYGQGWHHPLA